MSIYPHDNNAFYLNGTAMLYVIILRGLRKHDSEESTP